MDISKHSLWWIFSQLKCQPFIFQCGFSWVTPRMLVFPTAALNEINSLYLTFCWITISSLITASAHQCVFLIHLKVKFKNGTKISNHESLIRKADKTWCCFWHFLYCVLVYAGMWSCGVKERVYFNVFCTCLRIKQQDKYIIFSGKKSNILTDYSQSGRVSYIDIFLKRCWFRIVGYIKLLVLQDK